MNDSIAKNMKDNRNFWNDAARSGAIIGAVLGVSALVESQMALSGNLRWFAWLVVEYLVVVALHFWLLYRFTRRRSQLYSAEEGFTFGEAYKFLLTVSAFGGAIAGAVQALYVHVLLGFDNFLDRYLASVTSVLTKLGGIDATTENMLSQIFDQLRSAAAPSIVSTWLGGIWSGVLFGLVFGLIIAGVLARRPKPFDTPTHE